MKKLLIALGVVGASLAILAAEPAAHADMNGTAWGTLVGSPACASGICVLTLTTTTATTVVFCAGEYYGPCSVIVPGSTVIIPVYARLLPSCGGVPVTTLSAAALPRWY